MANRTLNSIIKIKRDTSANWETIDPVLALGEIAYDTTNNKLKVGDGISEWNNLDYISNGSTGSDGEKSGHVFSYVSSIGGLPIDTYYTYTGDVDPGTINLLMYGDLNSPTMTISNNQITISDMIKLFKIEYDGNTLEENNDYTISGTTITFSNLNDVDVDIYYYTSTENVPLPTALYVALINEDIVSITNADNFDKLNTYKVSSITLKLEVEGFMGLQFKASGINYMFSPPRQDSYNTDIYDYQVVMENSFEEISQIVYHGDGSLNIELTEGIDYTISGQTITFLNYEYGNVDIIYYESLMESLILMLQYFSMNTGSFVSALVQFGKQNTLCFSQLVINSGSGSSTLDDNTNVNFGSDSNGDTYYYNGSNLVRLGIGGNYDVLQVINGVPTWTQLDNTAISESMNLVPSGVIYTLLQAKADLENGKLKIEQLPDLELNVSSYIVGSTPLASDWLSTTYGGDALTPATNKIYIVKTSGNYYLKQYVWDGSTYVIMSSTYTPADEISTAGLIYTWETDHYMVGNDSETYSNGYNGTEKDLIISEYHNDGTHGRAKVTRISQYAFRGNETIESIKLPDCLESIGLFACFGCENLKYVNLERVTTLGIGCFILCGIKEVTLNPNLASLGESVFQSSEIESLKLPRIITSIPAATFLGTKIKELVISDNVTSIASSAINNNTLLQTIYCFATTPPTLADYSSINGNTSLTAIYVPYASLTAYKTADEWDEYADIIYPIPDKWVKEIIDTKVDKVDGKGLSTNDYDNTEKQNVADNTLARHTHSNKIALDNVSGTNTGDQDITGKEDISNKVTSINSNSTDTQYPSAKCVYDNFSLKELSVTNYEIETTDWVSDSTYGAYEFNYKADIVLSGMLSSYQPEVIFSVADSLSENYSSFSISGTDKITIYAKEVPSASLIIQLAKGVKL